LLFFVLCFILNSLERYAGDLVCIKFCTNNFQEYIVKVILTDSVDVVM